MRAVRSASRCSRWTRRSRSRSRSSFCRGPERKPFSGPVGLARAGRWSG
jgi:hypothetical protein